MPPASALLSAVASFVVFGVAAGCQPAESQPTFQPGFLMGVATAGFQNDPGCPTTPESECVDAHSDWYHYVTDPTLRASDHTYLSGDPLSVYSHVLETWVEGLKVFDRADPKDRLMAVGGYGAGRDGDIYVDECEGRR